MHPRFRISNLERNNFILPLNLKEILIGLLLGDLYIQKYTKNGNTNLQFEQGLVHKDYIFHLYDLFKDYCNAEPRISDRKPDSLAWRTPSTQIKFIQELDLILMFYLVSMNFIYYFIQRVIKVFPKT